MNILHLTTFLQGGAGLAIAELAAAQRRAGHAVAVVTSHTGAPGYGNYPAYLNTLARADVVVHLVDSSFTRDVAANLNVARVVERELGGAGAFDVMHTHAATPSLIALLLASRTTRRVPIVQTMHGWGLAKSRSHQRSDIAVMNFIDRVVVPAATSERLLQSMGVDRARISVIPYGVGAPSAVKRADDGLLAELHAWRLRGGTVLCCIGTLSRRKNQGLLVEALPLLEGAVLCVFVGDGADDELRALAERLGVEGLVRFAGYRLSARCYLREADLFVLPSLSEGQPLSILEAFCDGVPVLASDIPALAELVEHGVTGFLFDPADAHEIAAVIERARRLTPKQRHDLCARARNLYESRFTLDTMVDGYMNEYRRAV